MPGLAGEMIVAVWEAAREQRPLDRALTMLACASPGQSRDDFGRLPIGERDRRLFALREQLFGPVLALSAGCPACREANEFELSSRDLVRPAIAGPLHLELGDRSIAFRMPNSLDLARALDSDAPLEELARCLIGDACDLGPAELAQLAVAVEAADPLAEVRLGLACAACGHAWKPLLDIGELLYAELGAAARDLLGQVHALATAYKWREADILAMSPARRQIYLQMVGHE